MPRKKKTGIVESADLSEALDVYNNERLVSKFDKQQVWPKVVKGSHLTVYTYSDGSTKLEWDDEALTRDVQNALTEYADSVKVNTVKTTKRKKKNEA